MISTTFNRHMHLSFIPDSQFSFLSKVLNHIINRVSLNRYPHLLAFSLVMRLYHLQAMLLRPRLWLTAFWLSLWSCISIIFNYSFSNHPLINRIRMYDLHCAHIWVSIIAYIWPLFHIKHPSLATPQPIQLHFPSRFYHLSK